MSAAVPVSTVTARGVGPAVVLLHGFLFDRSMWEPQLDALAAAGYRGIAADLVGFGDSVVDRDSVPLTEHADAAADALRRLGVESAVVVGHSMGGQVALDLARRYPELVRAILLSDTFAHLDADAVRAGRRVLADRLATEGTHDYAREFLPAVLGATTLASRPEVCATALAMIERADGPSAAAALRGRADRADLSDAARGLTVPALALTGSEDVFDGGKLALGLAEAIPGCELVVLDATGHTPSLEDPAAFDDVLLGFLARLT
ncbi:alpha/beta hydrolase [Tsukamurella sp. 8F]|uniref:alpha/beta fold hydrolase n=1 Tax=unclassified Tsukamurella TaxID=2633480 RepID=UPI0023B9CFD6|nr:MULTISPECIES: alpha/beta hydrolase [unclassified Tsukamurella]MDF0528616.1 alpha/beta hydrolase [Tsukamurella sp. 8J]MDF0585578.1 alpha/beta hydrolase [Tsukamurella sp. 8F]